MTLEHRFWSVVERGKDCWLWTGPHDRYGTISVDGRNRAAHRLAYELVKGPIPEGMQIDHLCRNTLCVNPDHLEAVTSRENTLRGIGPTAVNAAATHCRRGHPFDDANTLIDGRGRRGCKACANLRQKQWRKRNPEQAVDRDRRYRRRLAILRGEPPA